MGLKQTIVRIVECQRTGGCLRTSVIYDRLPSSPIAPASLHERNEAQSLAQDLHRLVRRTRERLTFETYGDVVPLPVGGSFYLFTWWTLGQLEIVQDGRRVWRKVEFEPRDAILFERNGGRMWRAARAGEPLGEGTLVVGGWDHEHCCLCGEKDLGARGGFEIWPHGWRRLALRGLLFSLSGLRACSKARRTG